MKFLSKSFRLLLLSILFLPMTASAAEFRATETGTEIVAENQTADNLYVAANTLQVDGTVNNDLVAAASTILIRGDVEDDLITGAANLNISGSIGGNARVAGGTSIVSGTIGQDLVGAGGTITLASDSVVSGDVVIAGGIVELQGTIDGDVRVAGGNVIISGTVNGDVLLKNVDQLQVTDSAVINGTLTYFSPREGDISDQATIAGGVEFNQVKARDSFDMAALFTTTILYEFLGSLVVLLFFVYFLPRFTTKIVGDSYASPWLNIGVGLVILLVIPIILLLLGLLVVGLKIAFILGLVYLLLVSVAGAFVALLSGTGLFKLLKRTKTYEINWIVALSGIVLAIALTFIPFVGWLIIFFFFVLALGSISRWAYQRIAENR